MKFCNCSVAFLFPAKGYPECTVSGLVCMIKYNDLVNNVKPQVKNVFFDENEDGLDCVFLPECSRINYNIELSPIYNEKRIDPNHVLVHVNFASSTMMKYRTDVTFSGLDLLAGFGGIVSLFLGFSLLSGAEIFYYTTIALFWHRQRSKVTRKKIIEKIKTRLPFLN